MAKRSTKASEEALTEETNEATEVEQSNEQQEPSADLEVVAEPAQPEAPVAEEETKQPARDTSPVIGTLNNTPGGEPAINKISKEQIEATIKEKLSRKTDSPGSDLFVPNTQLENEVKEIAKAKGFPLSRGTEIGARLLARSTRIKK